MSVTNISPVQIDNAKDIDIVMPMYNLIEFSDNYSKTSGSLWHHYRDESFLNTNGVVAHLPADQNNSTLFKFKTKIASRTEIDGTKTVKVRVPLRYFSNFLRTLEIQLISCEITPILTCSGKCFIIDAPIDGQERTLELIDTKHYVPVVTLSTQDNAKLLEQLKSGYKKTSNWNKYEPKVTVEQQN